MHLQAHEPQRFFLFRRWGITRTADGRQAVGRQAEERGLRENHLSLFSNKEYREKENPLNQSRNKVHYIFELSSEHAQELTKFPLMDLVQSLAQIFDFDDNIQF
ncbi:hypothetical protein AVEN_60406-1 [Araneus ventricosus]|uniref:Uncharacterized protein n=1 Tax=Araneus ventricosus TaxID=182803 RepID=A0A4Y2H208_ARAVE|nr:hypothetical protein AVEN_60406-1 [Araneus ventricosus]